MSFRFLILASLATASLVFAAAANASGYGGHGGSSHSYGHSYGGGYGGNQHGSHRNYSYSYAYRHRPRNYGHKTHHGYNSHYGSSHSYGGAHGGYVNRGHGGYYSGGCKSVYKIDYWNGHKARIGGTQCYDHYGNPYVVLGSRYVIEYLSRSDAPLRIAGFRLQVRGKIALSRC